GRGVPGVVSVGRLPALLVVVGHRPVIAFVAIGPGAVVAPLPGLTILAVLVVLPLVAVRERRCRGEQNGEQHAVHLRASLASWTPALVACSRTRAKKYPGRPFAVSPAPVQS